MIAAAAPETNASAGKEKTELELALEFSDLQGQRTAVFNDFNKGFTYFISKEASMHEYEHLVEAVTPLFQNASLAVQELIGESKVRWGQEARYVVFMEAVQQKEKSKLHLTVQMQTLWTETVFGEIDHSEEVAELLGQIKTLEQDISETLQDMRELMVETEDF
ncbi:hypothetical protein HDU91_006143 [Kappamyces sp. JEL0680]|nr:hypothetical protein HDU91_006143 [Kappamyces sp. JEL0680]